MTIPTILEETFIDAQLAVDARGLKIMLLPSDPFNPQNLVNRIHAITAGTPVDMDSLEGGTEEQYFNLATNIILLGQVLRELAREHKLNRERMR